MMVSEVLYRVASLTPLSNQVTRVRLHSPKEHALRYRAGQYIKVIYRGDNQSPFSICSAPTDIEHLEFDFSHAANNHSALAILQIMKEQGQLKIRGPYGTCTTKQLKNAPIIFLAAGTGISPVKALMEEWIAAKHFPKIHLYWVVPTEADLYLDALAKEWVRTVKDFRYSPVVGRKMLLQMVLQDHPDLSKKQVYASGPESMIAAVQEGFKDHGLKKENLYSDIFDYDHNS